MDEFRAEMDYEAALKVNVGCLAALAELERTVGKLPELKRSAFYYLALVRSGCQDAEEAFRVVIRQIGCQFADHEKEFLIRLIDAHVNHAPIVFGGNGPEFGGGKTGAAYRPLGD